MRHLPDPTRTRGYWSGIPAGTGRPAHLYCRPTNSVKALNGKISQLMDLLTPNSPLVFQLCLWLLIDHGYLGEVYHASHQPSDASSASVARVWRYRNLIITIIITIIITPRWQIITVAFECLGTVYPILFTCLMWLCSMWTGQVARTNVQLLEVALGQLVHSEEPCKPRVESWVRALCSIVSVFPSCLQRVPSETFPI